MRHDNRSKVICTNYENHLILSVSYQFFIQQRDLQKKKNTVIKSIKLPQKSKLEKHVVNN